MTETQTGVEPSGSAAVPLSVEEAASFVTRENRLLDEVALEEWLSLFTADGVYWLPIVDGPVEEAAAGISIVYDDRERLSERIFRTLGTPVLDQSPRSRTLHVSSNVEVSAGRHPGEVRVLCNSLVWEMRVGGDRQVGLNQVRTLAGRCEYWLRQDEGTWRMALKKVHLLDADQPLYNLSFLL